MNELTSWLDTQNITYNLIDDEVVEVPGFGKLFLADLTGVDSIFRTAGDKTVFNLMENPEVLMEEGIDYVAFPFGNNWYYYDLREEFRFNILKYVGKPKEYQHPRPYVNLGIHTPFELLNASGDLSVWVRKAQWLGHRAIGICDRNTMAGTLNLQKACTAADIKPVFGYSFTMAYQGEQVDMKIYSLTQQGLSGLLRFQKEIMVDTDDHVLNYELLLTHATGNALVFASRAAEWMLRHPQQVSELKEVFDMTFYQVDLNEYKAERIDRQQLYAVQTYFRNFYDTDTGSYSVEPILITDCYYPDRDDARSKIVLNKIASGAAHEQSDDQYFKTIDEHHATMRPLFGAEWNFQELFERMCRNTLRIADAAEARYATGQMFMPQYIMRTEEKAIYGSRRAMFRQLLEGGLSRKVPVAAHDKYQARLEEEVYIIESTDNVDYFLIQWDMVQEAHRRGIVTGIGRGSAGGSLVSYLLGITTIDPIRFGLIFSRFLVPERCGLEWRDTTTIIAPPRLLMPGERCVEIELEGKIYRLHADAQLRINCNGEEHTVYADELSCGDEIILDRRDYLWTLNELTTQSDTAYGRTAGKMDGY